MRIGYFCSLLPYADEENRKIYCKRYGYGGIEEHVLNLAISMAKRGNAVTIITSSINNKNHLEQMGNVNVYRFASAFQYRNAFFPLEMFINLKKFEFDICHAHVHTPSFDFGAYIYATLNKVPLVVTYHGEGKQPKEPITWRLMKWLYYQKYTEMILFPKAKYIICHSPFFVEESANLRKYRAKVSIIGTGVNTDDFKPGQVKSEYKAMLGLKGKKVVLCVGSLELRKGQDLVIRAVPLVKEAIPDIMIVIAGIGQQEAYYRELAKELNVENYVSFPGFIQGEQKFQYYQAADLFILPSQMPTGEVFPIVFLEAAAAGLPIIATNLNTFKCFIEHEINGLFVEKEHGQRALSDAILRLLGDEKFGQTLGENARKMAANFTWNNIAAQTEELYLRAMSSKEPGK